MTREYLEEEFKRVQNIIDQEKENYGKGKISSGAFYAYVVGVFTAELSLFFNNRFNTDLDDLDLGKIGGEKNA